MKYIFLIFIIVNVNLLFSQFQSGNVQVTSPLCSYNLTGNWSDTITNTSDTLSFIYDSILDSWKYIIPTTATNIEVCVNTIQPCPCDTQCQTQIFPNLFFNFSICNTVPITQLSKKEIIVYPNPYKNYLSIDSPDLINKVLVLNSMGFIIDELTPQEKKFTYNKEISTGIYTFLIFTNNKRKTIRVEKYD